MIFFHKNIRLLLFSLLFIGCGVIGPASMKKQRNRYNQVVAYTGSEQMLINLVKLKYRDNPTFLQVSSISTNLQWGGSAGVNVPVGNTIYSAENLVPLSAGTNYVENSTVTYTTLTGEAFVRQMLTPIPIETLSLLFQAGWPIDTVFRLVVQEINDLENTGRLCLPIMKANFCMASCLHACENRGGASKTSFPGRAWERDRNARRADCFIESSVPIR